MQGIVLTTIAIIISILLLMVNTFIAIEKAPTKVRVVNSAIMPVDSPQVSHAKIISVSKELNFQADFNDLQYQPFWSQQPAIPDLPT